MDFVCHVDIGNSILILSILSIFTIQSICFAVSFVNNDISDDFFNGWFCLFGQFCIFRRFYRCCRFVNFWSILTFLSIQALKSPRQSLIQFLNLIEIQWHLDEGNENVFQNWIWKRWLGINLRVSSQEALHKICIFTRFNIFTKIIETFLVKLFPFVHLFCRSDGRRTRTFAIQARMGFHYCFHFGN